MGIPPAGWKQPMETLIDLFELHGRAPAIEIYRAGAAPLVAASDAYSGGSSPADGSVDFDVDLQEDDVKRASLGFASDRSYRARLWSSED